MVGRVFSQCEWMLLGDETSTIFKYTKYKQGLFLQKSNVDRGALGSIFLQEHVKPGCSDIPHG